MIIRKTLRAIAVILYIVCVLAFGAWLLRAFSVDLPFEFPDGAYEPLIGIASLFAGWLLNWTASRIAVEAERTAAVSQTITNNAPNQGAQGVFNEAVSFGTKPKDEHRADP